MSFIIKTETQSIQASVIFIEVSVILIYARLRHSFFLI
ncbi:hypothetical protein LEP1GSC034_0075 [Leptospira interrogans str. 2003000735]|uniref:Uncharacterized protein n=2 Tax=Leptospira interrogans TaxID=173 RepID=A0A829CYN2_LEPIR|nr:hypothetical protein LEP1GSC007_0004 [Leptospira interrogans serovar Bulgarica str. Mallika]EKN89700.1 hypothetical protein LEP1GSC027_4404 [Leptospira interrogans str. 2002000624]EKQ39152.1 hypothetical protein LEP1GSC025_4351 [Leptospira interrogans str. 2002000621]EKQ47947.1 hypothetical protein LEP1GSC026_4150 [Leptospira interrogans str. 2002000623]EMJ68334.1 hypothetical protein LEP1GSC033_3633 [Leptospira interrogans str. 2002000632]EMJ69211.1 hypothetical protein LEP1GSC034_0075 [Le